MHVRLPLFDRFAGLRKDIKLVIQTSVDQTARYLPLHDVDIRIKNDPSGVIPEHAHSGWTYSKDKVQIKINPQFSDREQLLHIELPRAISHELHHAVRDKALPNEPKTLGAALIKEGLAVVFETDVWGGEPSAWAQALTEEQIHDLLSEAIKESNNDTYNSGRWFFGKSDLPRWTGYSIGTYLIKEYLKLHPNETAASLVTVPAAIILNELGDTILPVK